MKGSLVHNAGRNYKIPRWPAAIGTAVMSALKRFVRRWFPSFLLPNFPFLGSLSVCWVDANDCVSLIARDRLVRGQSDERVHFVTCELVIYTTTADRRAVFV